MTAPRTQNIGGWFDDQHEARFWRSVGAAVGTTCWLWLGALDRDGYGRYRNRHSTERAHRVSYLVFIGPVPVGLVLDHLCRNRACVNPTHLEAVTSAENTRRGVGGYHFLRASHQAKAQSTTCKHGHEYTPENTYLWRGDRHCRTCRFNTNMRHRQVAK